MSKIVDINVLAQQFAASKSLEEWVSFAETQHVIIESYQKEIDLLRLKNRQLEAMLVSKTNLITELTPEENICIQQIDRLEKLSIERQLTLDEVKRLDLLVKNLKLIREESTIVVNNQGAEKLGEAELVAIAAGNTQT